MQQCKACGVTIRGDKTCCPLCGGPLAGDRSEGAYPAIPGVRQTWAGMVRTATGVFLLFVLVMGTIEWRTGYRHPWMLLALAAALVLWIDLILNAHYQHNVIKMLTVQAYIGIGVTLLVDWLTGYRGWAVTWVIPFVFLGLAVTTLAVARGLQLRLSEYIFYLVLDAALSLVQILFLCLHMEIRKWPLILSVVIMVAGAAAALRFRRREVQVAMKKVFHA